MWQLKGKNFGSGSQDDIIIGRNKTMFSLSFQDLVALTCPVGKCKGIILQSGEVFVMSWHLKSTYQTTITQFYCLHENLPQAQPLYITSHYWKIKRNITALGSSSFEDVLCCLQHFRSCQCKQIPHHRAQKPHHSAMFHFQPINPTGTQHLREGFLLMCKNNSAGTSK